MDSNIEKLVEQAIHGDKQALDNLLRERSRKILFTAMKFLNDTEDAKDAAQEAMLHVYRHITELKEPKAFDSWLYKVVMCSCASYARKMRKKSDLIPFETPLNDNKDTAEELRREFLPLEYMEDEQKREILMQIIDGLSKKHKQCLLLYYYNELTYKEIAAATGMNVKQVDNALTMAKDKIRMGLAKDTETRDFLKPTYVLVPIPVLTRIFAKEAETLVTAEMANGLADSALAAANGAGSSSGGDGGSSSTLSTAAKVIIGVIIAAGVALAAWAVFGRDQEPPAESVPSVVSETPSSEPSEPVSEPEPEQPIITVADMINEENAAILNGFVETATDEAAWGAFLEKIGASREDQGASYTHEYTMYLLEKQDKRLVLIGQKDKDTGSIDVAYQFAAKDDLPVPQNIEIVIYFDQWRS